MEKIDKLLNKQMVQVKDITSQLEKVSPINNTQTGNDLSDGEFMNSINAQIEDTKTVKNELDEIKDKLDGFVDEIEKIMLPLTILHEREVKLNPEIEQILQNMKEID